MKQSTLDEKAAEVLRHLNEWGKTHPHDPLLPGQFIVFSLRSEMRDVVERDPSDALGYAEEVLDIKDRKPIASMGFKRYVAPAVLTPAQVEQIVSLVPPNRREVLRDLLKRNNPLHIREQHQMEINRALRGKKIDGKQYTVAGLQYRYQLWEVE